MVFTTTLILFQTIYIASYSFMEKVPIVCTQFSSEHINSEIHCNSNTNLDGFTKDRAGGDGKAI